MRNWKIVPLGEIAEEITVGYVGSMANEYVDSGVPFLRSLNIRPFRFDPTDLKFISPEFHLKIRKSALKPGDVAVVRTGNSGVSCVIPEELADANCSDLVVIRPGEKLDPEFVSYYINSITKSHIKGQLVGAIQQHFNIGAAKEIHFPNISRQEQKKLSSTLSALDAKIALNQRINVELEGMAKLLYDYWFVQYDFPLSAAQAAALGKPRLVGQPYRTSGGPMVYHEHLKREIPKGWEVKKLCEIEANIITGKTPPTSDPANFSGNIPFICIGDVRGNMHIVKTELSLSSKGAALQQNKFIPTGAICVTCIASPGLVAFATRDSQTNQQLNSIVCEREEHRPFLYFYLKDYFVNSAGAKIGNTFANMNKGDFSAIPVVKPGSTVIKLFSEKVEGLFSLVLTNSLQNQELTTLRDWLLPMLMNGQVRVG